VNREGIVTGLLGLGLGLTTCSVILALTFSKVTRGEELTWTSGTYMISVNWVWLSNLFLTCGLGMFIVAATIPILKRVAPKTLIAIVPISAIYLLIAGLDIVTTHVLVKSGMGNEVNPIMSLLINVFGVSYALSLNFALSIFIIIGLIYFTERFLLFSAFALPISVIRGFVVYGNMKLIKGYTFSLWFTVLKNLAFMNLPMAILFFLSVALGITLALAFPEEEGEYSFLSIPSLRSLRLSSKTEQNELKERLKTGLVSEELMDEFVDPVEFTLLLEKFRIKQEVVESLLEISKEVSKKKGIPPDQVTIKDIVEELRRTRR